ncbi:MAG: ATP-binding cassette domain-containing protein [Variovorax sp.]
MSADSAIVLRVEDLHFAYPGEAPVLSGWSAAIGPGVTQVHGDTASGKSTLLRVLAGRLPAMGRLTLKGVRLDADREAWRRKVFFIDPGTDVFDQVTGHACTASLRSGDADFDEASWRALVDEFSLAPHLEKPMYMLSTGSKRKVWLAAALASGRPLVLLDEPTGGLDGGSTRCLWRALDAMTQHPERAVVVASSEIIDQVPLAGRLSLQAELP